MYLSIHKCPSSQSWHTCIHRSIHSRVKINNKKRLSLHKIWITHIYNSFHPTYICSSEVRSKQWKEITSVFILILEVRKCRPQAVAVRTYIRSCLFFSFFFFPPLLPLLRLSLRKLLVPRFQFCGLGKTH